MKSKYYAFSVIILAYMALGLLAETLIHLQIAAMRLDLSSLFGTNSYLVIATLTILIGYATVKGIKPTA